MYLLAITSTGTVSMIFFQWSTQVYTTGTVSPNIPRLHQWYCTVGGGREAFLATWSLLFSKNTLLLVPIFLLTGLMQALLSLIQK